MQREDEATEQAPRPVRTVTLEKSEAGVPVADRPHRGARLGIAELWNLRPDGERTVNFGDRVEARAAHGSRRYSGMGHTWRPIEIFL